MEKIISNDKIYRLVIALLGLLAAVSLVQGCRNAWRDSQDFQWDATKTFTLGINPYDESLSPTGILDQYGYDEYYLQMEANQFPSLLMILVPFTFLKPLTARYVWLVFNLFLTALMIFLLRKTFLKDVDEKIYTILMLLMIAGTPYRNHIGVGQHTIFAFTFFLLAVYLADNLKNDNKKQRVLQVIAVSICLFICYFKYTLTVPLVLYFIYRKRYLEIAVSVLAHGVLTVIAGLWLNNSVIDMIIKPLKVSSRLSTEGGLDISALLKGSPVAYVILLAIMVMLFVLSLKLEKGFDNTLMAVLVLWSLIITYHRTYDFFVMAAVAGAFKELKDIELFGIEKNKAALAGLEKYYYVVLLAVFFVLRLFSENMFSKLIVGTMYYVLTFTLTGFLIYTGLKKNSNK